MGIDLGNDRATFNDLMGHVGHEIEIVTYGLTDTHPWTVSMECLDCDEVLISVDSPEVS